MAIGIGYAALSGLQSAQKAIDMVAHNTANVETEGYHRIDAVFKELGPFPTIAGVDVEGQRAQNDFLDNALQTATMNKANSDIVDDALAALDGIKSDTLESSYSEMMEMTHKLLQNPDDAVVQESFNKSAVNWQNNVNRYQGQLDEIKKELTLKMDIQSARTADIQARLQEVAKNGTTDPNEIYNLKMELMQTTGSVEAYRKVLSSIVPPVEFAFKNAVNTVQTSMNELSGQEVFKDSKVNQVTDFSTFDESKLPEWDSHWFNTELGLIKTRIGFQMKDAQAEADLNSSIYDKIKSDWHDAVGVDLVEEQVKMMNYQRMYEANAQVIKTQDEMIGTLLNIKA